MDEISFTIALVEQIKPSFPSYEVATGISIFYSLSINEDGNIPIKQNEKGEPIRGNGTGFEQDILLFERVTAQTSIVPRVAIEVKFGGVTTHDAIVYSEKARRLRNVYPYLRYGFLIGGVSSLPPRLIRIGTDFDFILRMSTPPLHDEQNRLIELVKEEIKTSLTLGKAFSRQVSIQLLRRKVVIESSFDIDMKIPAAANQTNDFSRESLMENPDSKIYYVYENWVAEKKAVIHYGSCSFCKYGQGSHANSSTHNGRWHGPFATFEIAEKVARDTGRPIRTCRICAPR